MRLNLRRSFIVLFSIFIFQSGCGTDDGVVVNGEVNEFVWQAMNQFYFWQSSVPELSDDKAQTRSGLNAFVNQYSSPESLFEDLLFRDDRFSRIYNDYEVLEASFQGISTSFGYEFQLINPSGTNDVFGFVKYVVPPSVSNPDPPAYAAGLERGDLFTEINGTKLSVDNYFPLLFQTSSYTLTIGEVIDGNVVSTTETLSMSAIQIAENPIHLYKVLEISGTKVGYLSYNQFVNNDSYHRQLNEIFGYFVNEGITELVLDLRYNPGGSVYSSQVLASFIYGAGTSESVFSSSVFNEKITSALGSTDFNFYFLEEVDGVSSPLNRLSISRIFILTSGNTASASELIISGLLPYMEVQLIGDTTVGKNAGSITLYDSPNLEKSPANSNVNHTNPSHKYAIQPIVSLFSNADGFTDYVDGFVPNILIEEKDLIGSILPLGDPNEHLLGEALSVIDGSARRYPTSPRFDLNAIYDSRQKDVHLETMQMDVKDLPLISDFQ